MLGLLLFQGLVYTKLHKITIEDVDINKAVINIQGSKKSNGRKIPLNASQIGSIINYMNNIRPQFLTHYSGNSNKLFLSTPTKTGMPHTELHLASIYTFRGQIKTLDASFKNFKQIRASVITRWIKTQGLRKAQYLTGHRYISSTEHYLPNDLESLTDDIAKYNPLRN